MSEAFPTVGVSTLFVPTAFFLRLQCLSPQAAAEKTGGVRETMRCRWCRVTVGAPVDRPGCCPASQAVREHIAGDSPRESWTGHFSAEAKGQQIPNKRKLG